MADGTLLRYFCDKVPFYLMGLTFNTETNRIAIKSNDNDKIEICHDQIDSNAIEFNDLDCASYEYFQVYQLFMQKDGISVRSVFSCLTAYIINTLLVFLTANLLQKPTLAHCNINSNKKRMVEKLIAQAVESVIHHLNNFTK